MPGARLLTDPHLLPFYRGNGIVRNVDAGYAAFDMNPAMRCILPPATGSISGETEGRAAALRAFFCVAINPVGTALLPIRANYATYVRQGRGHRSVDSKWTARTWNVSRTFALCIDARKGPKEAKA